MPKTDEGGCCWLDGLVDRELACCGEDCATEAYVGDVDRTISIGALACLFCAGVGDPRGDGSVMLNRGNADDGDSPDGEGAPDVAAEFAWSVGTARMAARRARFSRFSRRVVILR